jgi:hypothetical protein
VATTEADSADGVAGLSREWFAEDDAEEWLCAACGGMRAVDGGQREEVACQMSVLVSVMDICAIPRVPAQVAIAVPSDSQVSQ